MPSPVDRYFKDVKKQNPSYSDEQAWATAWSIYCKHKNPGSDHCKKDPDEYLTGKSAAVSLETRVAARYESAAKPDFYTPASFKHVADKFSASLKVGSGVDWKLAGVQKSNRKTFEGVESYLSAKFYPEDRSKPMSAELSVSMIARPSGPLYRASAVVERSTKVVFEEHHESRDFADMSRWIMALNLGAAGWT